MNEEQFETLMFRSESIKNDILMIFSLLDLNGLEAIHSLLMTIHEMVETLNDKKEKYNLIIEALENLRDMS